LAAYKQGLDLADALHLVRSNHCHVLMSFDKRLQKRAKAAGLLPIVEVQVKQQ
jgi:hypothetical protein